MTRPLSVAVVAACPLPYPRGTPIRIFRSAEAMSEKGLNIHVVTYHIGEPLQQAPFKIHRIANVPTYHKLEAGPTYQKLLVVDVLLMRTLRKLLEEQQIDVIHAHNYEGLLVALGARGARQCPVIYDAHTMLESELPFYRLGMTRGMKRSLGRRLDRWLPRRADHVIAVTTRIRDELAAGAKIAPENLSVVSSGIEWEFFADRFKQPNRRDNHAPVLVFAGNLAAYQGIELLLHAFGEVHKRRPEARLRIVTRSSFDAYRPLAEHLGIAPSIDLIDSDFDELPRILSESDIAVSPRTEGDGLPQKLLNYMAAGLPIVSFAGSAKTIEHDRTGWVVENGNVRAFSEGILRLAEDADLASRLGTAARARARTEYTWSRTADGMIRVYQQAMELRGS